MLRIGQAVLVRREDLPLMQGQCQYGLDTSIVGTCISQRDVPSPRNRSSFLRLTKGIDMTCRYAYWNDYSAHYGIEDGYGYDRGQYSIQYGRTEL